MNNSYWKIFKNNLFVSFAIAVIVLSDAFFETVPDFQKDLYNFEDFNLLLNTNSPFEPFTFNFNTNIVLTIASPLLLGLLVLFLQNKINQNKIIFIVSFWNFVIVLILIFFFFYNHRVHVLNVIKLFDFINILDLNITLDFLIDPVTFVMAFIVQFISFCVVIFAFWYMKGDPNFLKFIAFLNFFSFFMMILVTANNLVLIFVGWEGIGLFSYFLINFWNTRLNANRSALKALFVNKIGDCFFYFFIFSYFFIFESLHIYDVKCLFSSYVHDYGILMQLDLVYFMVFSIIIAAMAKSAQVILHVWLPDAMEGPTPVSALLHAATMVTAGIYILIKFNWLVSYSPQIYSFVILIGIFTNLLASLTALFQHDIKKIIAYSTASQLGLIFIAYGTLQFNYALFHIYNHSFFKALLFMLAGVMIHYLFNNQDLRNIFFFKKNNFFLYSLTLIASLSLIGFPYLSAFYSKDFIINYSFINMHITGDIVVFFLCISVITTFLYAFKIINFLFFNHQTSTFSGALKHVTEKIFYNLNKDFPLVVILEILALCSIVLGYTSAAFFQNDFLNFTSNLIADVYLERKNSFDYLELSCLLIIFLILYAIPVLMFRFLIIKFKIIFSDYWKLFYFFNKKTLFDNFYNYSTRILLASINVQYMVMDKNIIEFCICAIVEFKHNLMLKVKNLYLNFTWWAVPIYVAIIATNSYLLLIMPQITLLFAISFLISLSTSGIAKYYFNKFNK